jgi:hypothetical protein
MPVAIARIIPIGAAGKDECDDQAQEQRAGRHRRITSSQISYTQAKHHIEPPPPAPPDSPWIGPLWSLGGGW